MNQFYIFETSADLWPLDSLRPQSEITVGAYTVRERFEFQLGCPGRLLVRPELSGVASEEGLLAEKTGAGLYLPANALLDAPLPVDGPEEAGFDGDRLVYMRLGPERAGRFDVADPASAAEGLSKRQVHARFLDRPWHVLKHQEHFLERDCVRRSKHDHCRKNLEMKGVVIDESRGPVVLDESAQVGAFSVLEGPIYLGPGTVVKPHSHIRGTAVGRESRIGGEISGCTIFPFVNKQHAGFLGNSVVSSWVNIGAGTTGSNLKNTYGMIRHEGEETGMQFFGQIIGDHTKLGIMMGMNTGSIYGIGSNLFGGDKGFSSIMPHRIEDFRFGTSAAKIDVIVRTAKAVMPRRGCELTSAMEELIRRRFEEAVSEKQ